MEHRCSPCHADPAVVVNNVTDGAHIFYAKCKAPDGNISPTGIGGAKGWLEFVKQSLSENITAEILTLLDLRFDEGTGKIARYSSNYGNNGALEGAKWADGKRGKGIQVDGTTFVRVNNNPTLDVVGAFTLEFWIAATGADANIMAKVEEGKLGTNEWYASNYAYAFGGEGQLRFVIGGGDDETDANITSCETPLNDNKRVG